MRARISALLRRLVTASLVAICVPLAAAAAQDASRHSLTVQTQVASLLRALYRGDIETFLAYSHPKVIESLGGSENARVGVSELFGRIRASGVELDAIEFPEPLRFIKGPSTQFVIVPTLIRVSAMAAVRVESRSFQVGLLEPGTSTWKYVEGSRLTPFNMEVLLPGFPAGIHMPRIYSRKLE